MKVGRNLLSGLANSAWSALVSLAVVPLYLKYLGIEAYGLIGFFATTQALCQLLDMGLAPAVTREIARCSALDEMHEGQRLLHTLSLVYWGVAVAILSLILFLAPFIAHHWLQSRQIPAETVSQAVSLIGLVVASRWPIALYQGALMGAQRVVAASGINMLMTTLSALGAVVVLASVSPTIQAFFLWQAAVGLVYVVTVRRAAWRALGISNSSQPSWSSLRRVWRFAAGMSVVALSGIIFFQLDKLILSTLLSLDHFGQYMLATVVVSALYAVATPFFNVMYPRFSVLIASGAIDQLAALYRVSTRALASVLFPLAMLLVIFSRDLIAVWTGNGEIAEGVAPVIAMLALGSALHGVMHIPFALQLAYGNTRLPIAITLILMAFLAPLIVLLTLSHGIQGAALAWLTLHAIYLTLGTWLTHRFYLQGLAKPWVALDVGIPFAASAVCGLVGAGIRDISDFSIYGNCILGMGVAVVAVGLSGLTSPALRATVQARRPWASANFTS